MMPDKRGLVRVWLVRWLAQFGWFSVLLIIWLVFGWPILIGSLFGSLFGLFGLFICMILYLVDHH